MNVLITLDPTLGIDLGPNFSITANIGLVVPASVTKTELLAGIFVIIDNSATILYITSEGTCTNSLELLITGTPSTTTTTTINPTTTSTTTTTNPCEIEGDAFEDTNTTTTTTGIPETTTTTTSIPTTTTTTTVCTRPSGLTTFSNRLAYEVYNGTDTWETRGTLELAQEGACGFIGGWEAYTTPVQATSLTIGQIIWYQTSTNCSQLISGYYFDINYNSGCPTRIYHVEEDEFGDARITQIIDGNCCTTTTTTTEVPTTTTTTTEISTTTSTSTMMPTTTTTTSTSITTTTTSTTTIAPTTTTTTTGTTTTICPSVGDPFGGGKAAYIFEPGDYGYVSGECHGIVAQVYDIFPTLSFWGCHGTPVGASYTAIGYGLINTLTIIGGCSDPDSAAQRCYDLSDVNYTWFLPTREEVLKLYDNRIAIGNFTLTEHYFYSSSSEFNSINNWNIDFTDGIANSGTNSKGIGTKVRAIRYF